MVYIIVVAPILYFFMMASRPDYTFVLPQAVTWSVIGSRVLFSAITGLIFTIPMLFLNRTLTGTFEGNKLRLLRYITIIDFGVLLAVLIISNLILLSDRQWQLL
jgi:hypothetical protein